MTKQNTPSDRGAAGKRNSKKRYYTYRKVNKKNSLRPPQAKESVRVALYLILLTLKKISAE